MANGLTLGQLRWRIGAMDAGFRQVIQNADSQLRGFHSTVQRGASVFRTWGLAAAAMSATATGVAYAVSRVVNSTRQLASEVESISRQTGLAVETVQGLRYVADQTNVAYQTLESGMRAFARRSAEAARGNRAFLQWFEALGISQQEVAEGLHDIDELLLTVAERISQLPTEAEQSAIAMNLMSDAGRQLVPLLALGRDEIERLMNEAKELGIVLTAENIAAFSEYDAVLTRYRASMQGVRMTLATAVLPIFDRIARAVSENAGGVARWIRENRTFLTQVVVLGTALATLAVGFGTVTTAIFVAMRAAGLIAGVLSFLTSPIALVAAAAALLYVAWTENWLGIQDATLAVWGKIAPILESVREWEKRIISTVWEWTIRGLNWMSDTFIPWLRSLPERIRNRWEWTVEGLADLREAAALAVNRVVTWLVNLARGTWDAVTDWIDRVVTWTVNLAQGVADAVADWVYRAVTWLVNLARGSYEAVREWLQGAVTWAVNLVRGSYDTVRDWLTGAVTWTVNLVQGTYERVKPWIDAIVEWTVNLVRVTAEKASAAAQWLLGLLEGRAEARALTTDVDLELREASPGWGDRLETWLRRQLHALEWQEITEEEFRRLQEELGEKAEELLKIEDGRFFKRTPERLELAADFFLNLGNAVAGFVAGRVVYETLGAALRGLLQLAGWVWGALASGASGWLLPTLGWIAAIGIAAYVVWELLPDETQREVKSFLSDLFEWRLENILRGALGAAASVLVGVTFGASALAIAFAATLTFAIGLIDWDFAGAQIEGLWEKFAKWAVQHYEMILAAVAVPGFIRVPVKLVFAITGIQAELDAARARISSNNAAESTSTGGRTITMDELRQMGQDPAYRHGVPTTVNEVTKAAAASVNDVVDAIVAGMPHLERHRDVLQDMAERLMEIGEAKDAPLTLQELAEVMALLISETGTVLHDMEAMENPLRVTSAGFAELDRQGIQLTETTAGLNRNLEAGLELFRLYKREFSDPSLAAGAYLFPSLARRGEWDTPFKQPGTDVTGMTAGEKARRYQDLLNRIYEGGQKVGIEWAKGLHSAAAEADAAADALAQTVADYLVGQSPPPKGPLSTVDDNKIIPTWLSGMVQDLRDAGNLEEALKLLVDRMYSWFVGALEERFPGVAEFLTSLFEEDSALDRALTDLESALARLQDGISELEHESVQWARNLSRGIAEAIAHGRDLYDVFDQFLRMIAARWLEVQVVDRILGLGGDDGGWLARILGSIPIFHAGGLVLGGQRVAVMHSGAMVGLAPDEVPAILQVGERVLSRQQNDQFERMLEEQVNEPREVNHNYYIYAVDAASFADMVARNPDAVKAVVMEDLALNGPLRRMLRGGA